MSSKNYYDVTKWNVGNPYEDIGEVINSIIADIKKRQTDSNMNEGGKPGAVIYIPSGDYHLRTQVVIDISYLKIMGSGHGFVSSSIRYNLPENEWADLHEVWPGGSRILVDLSPKPGDEESAGAAFYVERDGNPRTSVLMVCILWTMARECQIQKIHIPMEKQVFILEVHRIHSGSQVWESYI